MKQETYGRFTHGAWNFIKSIELTGEQADKLRLMIEAKSETITKDEAMAMVHAVVVTTWDFQENTSLENSVV